MAADDARAPGISVGGDHPRSRIAAIVVAAKSSGARFPIDLEDVWGTIGYTRRNNAAAGLKERFEEGLFRMTPLEGSRIALEGS